MRRIVFYTLVLGVLASFTSQKRYVALKNSAFKKGEKLTYRLHYGFLNAGEGTVEVGDKLYKIDGKTCYKYRIYGRSTGAFNAVLRIRDTWLSYVDTNTLYPELAYRDIQEGKYVLKESTYFNQADTLTKVEWTKRDGVLKKKSYSTPKNVHDIVSGFYFIRNIDFTKLKLNEVVELKAFFDDEHYDFRIQFKGYDEVKTNLGKIHAIKLVPLMPDNSLFDGEDSIVMWLSADQNRVPLKCKAKMFVGAVELDIKTAKNLRYPLNYVKK